MINEERNLLLRDLCARLPYGVKGLHRGEVQKLLVMDSSGSYQVGEYNAWFSIDDVIFKPYLRPMSSMTEVEYKEYDKACELDSDISSNTLKTNIKAKKRVLISAWYHGTDWLIAHHFDYRGLIPMGLALGAPEGMYKTKERIRTI